MIIFIYTNFYDDKILKEIKIGTNINNHKPKLWKFQIGTLAVCEKSKILRKKKDLNLNVDEYGKTSWYQLIFGVHTNPDFWIIACTLPFNHDEILFSSQILMESHAMRQHIILPKQKISLYLAKINAIKNMCCLTEFLH